MLKCSPFNLAIYPHGFDYRSEKILDQPQPDHLKGIERGNIEGFSKKSASRLRQFMLKNWGGEDAPHPYAITLTTQGVYGPAEWESILKRFRTALTRKHPKWAACWRVELQKRQTPHLHCVFWLDQPLPAMALRIEITYMWVAATKEDNNDVWQYSVCVKDLVGHDAWMIYCTLHDSKSKKAQLGWKGRQWGIWNRNAWRERPPLTSGGMSQEQRVLFIRRLRAWSRGRFKGKRVRPLRIRFDSHLPAFVMEAQKIGQLLRGIIPEKEVF